MVACSFNLFESSFLRSFFGALVVKKLIINSTNVNTASTIVPIVFICSIVC